MLLSLVISIYTQVPSSFGPGLKPARSRWCLGNICWATNIFGQKNIQGETLYFIKDKAALSEKEPMRGDFIEIYVYCRGKNL
jgi:hypothetical protein